MLKISNYNLTGTNLKYYLELINIIQIDLEIQYILKLLENNKR